MSRIKQMTDPLIPKILQPDFPHIREEITRLLSAEGNIERRRNQAAAYILDQLEKMGYFVHSEAHKTYYFEKTSNQLIDLHSDLWQAYLASFCGRNEESKEFKYFENACRDKALFSDKVEVYTMSHWDGQKLYISTFNGRVLILDGQNVSITNNGMPFLFVDGFASPVDFPNFAPQGWERFVNHEGNIRELSETVNWSSNSELNSIGFQTLLYLLFFSDLCKEKPIILFRGIKGSGKTMLIRMLLKFLFGKNSEVTGITTEEAFHLQASNQPILVIDNLDRNVTWLKDLLATISTGIKNFRRRLYSHDLITMNYNSWIFITSRSPLTLERDDLLDRLVIFDMDRIPDDKRIRQSYFINNIAAERQNFWIEIVYRLNILVAYFRTHEIPKTSIFRVADFGATGAAINDCFGSLPEWYQFLRMQQDKQKQMLIGISTVYDILLKTFREKNEVLNRKITLPELFGHASGIAFALQMKDFPRTLKQFTTEFFAVYKHFAEFKIQLESDKIYYVTITKEVSNEPLTAE